jgi:hypothetical protein
MIDRIEKTYSMNVVGPKQYQTRRFETVISSPIPEEAKQQTPEGKKAFVALSDKLGKMVVLLTERDAEAAKKEAEGTANAGGQ